MRWGSTPGWAARKSKARMLFQGCTPRGERPQMFPWRMAEGAGKLDGFVVADHVPGEVYVALAGEIGAEFGTEYSGSW